MREVGLNVGGVRGDWRLFETWAGLCACHTCLSCLLVHVSIILGGQGSGDLVPA